MECYITFSEKSDLDPIVFNLVDRAWNRVIKLICKLNH